MTAAIGGNDGEAPAARGDDNPADALGDIWTALDALPRSSTSPTATATTIEMVAVSAQQHATAGPSTRAWLSAAGLVVAAFLGGAAAGRATLPSVEPKLLQQLPLIEQFDLLREAGSIEFLREVDRRHYPLPRRFPPLPPPADDTALERGLEALREGNAGSDQPAKVLAERLAMLESLSGHARDEIEGRIREWSRLSPTARKQLTELGRALANPDASLLAAARLWHAWVASRDPAERRTIVSLDTAERLEWLDRYARLQSRMQMRQFIERERPPRRGPPPFGETPPPPR